MSTRGRRTKGLDALSLVEGFLGLVQAERAAGRSLRYELQYVLQRSDHFD